MRVWGVADDRLIELRVEPAAGAGAGLCIEGLPEGRARTARDRVHAALVNSGLLGKVPSVTVRVRPAIPVGDTTDLDLPIAFALLGRMGRVPHGVGWIYAIGRLGLDGGLHADGLTGQATLNTALEVLVTPP